MADPRRSESEIFRPKTLCSRVPLCFRPTHTHTHLSGGSCRESQMLSTERRQENCNRPCVKTRNKSIVRTHHSKERVKFRVTSFNSVIFKQLTLKCNDTSLNVGKHTGTPLTPRTTGRKGSSNVRYMTY